MHLAAFSSFDIPPGIRPSSALRVDAARRLATTGTHLNDAKRKGNLGDTALDSQSLDHGSQSSILGD
jgi:hypothetical protein